MLARTEIQKLYDHVKKHKVVFVDVQIELVDHLASEKETIQIENPSIDFHAALTKASEKFTETTYRIKPPIGKTKYKKGFNGLIDQKYLVVRKNLNRRMIQYLLSFFKLPRIILILSIWIIIYKLVEFGEVTVVGRLVAIFLAFAFAYWIIRTQLFQRAHGIFMSLNFQIVIVIMGVPLHQGYFILQFIKWLDSTTFYFPLVASSIFTLWILSIYIYFIYLTNLLISEVEEKYGDHKLNFG